MSDTHKIVLSDGTKINATLNGNNYITKATVKESQFADLSSLTIDGEAQTDASLRNLWKAEDGTHLVFGTMTAVEKTATAINTAVTQNGSDITDIQVALADIYESMSTTS